MALTPKQEKFCHLYIETGNASEAYRQAYNAARMTEKSIGNRASELLQHRGIKGRVAVLQAEHRKAHDVTVESMAKEFADLARQSVESGQFGPAVAATKERAKLFGLYEQDNKQKQAVLNVVDAIRAADREAKCS